MNNGPIAVVTNIPRPYRRALFDTLKARLAAESFELRVFYTSDPAKHVRRGASSATISDPQVESYVQGLTFRLGYERVITIPTRLRRALERSQPACVVAGGFSADAMACARWCGAAKVPYVIWSGNWLGKNPEVGRLQRMTRRRLVRRADAFITYGSAAAEYLISLGAHPERVFSAWNTVDLESIAQAAEAAAANRSELTTKYGLATKNLLFVGSMVERKGVRELLAAALTAEPRQADWVLHFVGPGPLKDELERTAQKAGAEAHFRFHGARPKQDVAELLGVADGFLFPTKMEPWGLVINEAMACGVPVVVSPWAGATRDLIEDGVSGYVIEPTDTAALAGLISRLLAGDPSCQEVGRAGAESVRAKASLEKATDGFMLAIKCAMNHCGHGRR